MKRVLCASVLAMGCTIALSAQSGMADKPKDDKMAKDAKTVAVTGCVAEADGHYMLNNATWEGMTTPSTVALSGGTLKPHVGHKVEVTGTMKAMDKDAMKKDTMAKPDAMAGHDMKKDAAMAGTLTVKDLKMIAATCS
jgi:tRNA A37 methylthiotransferase MiaB